MKKKLLAVSVAGAFALPGVALAQTTVTISGIFKGGFETLRYGQSAKNPASQSGVVDDSSRIIFGVREDLGGGLAAIAQLDIRFRPDDVGALGTANVAGQLGSGNTWVGLTSKDWGRLLIGRRDLHYIHRESELTVRGSLRADSFSLLAFAGGGGTPIAAATRTQNVVSYTTPNWSGFTLDVAYSSNPAATESDIGSGVRRGRAWTLNPNMAGKNWQVGYSYWSSKPDGAGAVNQRGDRLYGSYAWGGLKVGLAWDKSRLRNLAGVQTSNRTAWSLPVQYTWGPHGIYGHYTRARDDKATVGVADGARMWALSYAYDFSKRTSVALTYARIRNDVAATYNLFASGSLGLGVGTGAIAPNEDPRMWGVTLRHAF